MMARLSIKFVAFSLLAFLFPLAIFDRRLLASELQSLRSISPSTFHLPLDPPDNLSPLKELCTRVQWVPGRIWKCDHLQGGTSNVYNIALHCIRFAIESGSTLFVLPKVWIRSTVDPILLVTDNETDLVDMAYLFDLSHLTASLNSACPQMELYHDLSSIKQLPTDPRYAHLMVPGLGAPDGFRNNLDGWLNGLTDTAGGPYLRPAWHYILQHGLFYFWNVRSGTEPENFADTFQSVLHFREDARTLAAAVLDRLDRVFSNSTALVPEDRVPFYGAHLRTGRDLTGEWAATGRDEQFDDYMSSAANNSFRVIYLASGAQWDVEYFMERGATEYPAINITTKQILLAHSPTLLRQLNALTSDQQAIVDFEVLARADRFAGMHRSSFDWQLVMRRHIKSKIPLADCLHHVVHMFEDETGHILNPEPAAFFEFFFHHTWP